MSGSDESQRMSSSNTFLRRSISELLNTESDDHCGSQFAVTESSAVVELADQWLRDLESMLKQLAAALNHFCRKYFDCEYAESMLDSCGDVDAGGTSFRLKPEYENSTAFVIARTHLQTLAKAVDAVRDVNPQVPFASEIVKALYTTSMPFDADGFEKAVAEWVTALRRLGVWAELQTPTSEKRQLFENDAITYRVSDKPHWDNESRELSYKDQTRTFAVQTGAYVKRILDVFQEFGWRDAEDNPLPTGDDAKAAIRTLNKSSLRLRFSKDGDRICWQEK